MTQIKLKITRHIFISFYKLALQVYKQEDIIIKDTAEIFHLFKNIPPKLKETFLSVYSSVILILIFYISELYFCHSEDTPSEKIAIDIVYIICIFLSCIFFLITFLVYLLLAQLRKWCQAGEKYGNVHTFLRWFLS